MGVKDSNVREWPIPAQRTAGPGFDLIASKLRLPQVRSGTIRRSSLIERLMRDDSRSIVSVVAPPGYGKTTLLSHWAERSTQAFAWVSIDEQDNDPRVLLSYVAKALDAVQPVGGRVFEALGFSALRGTGTCGEFRFHTNRMMRSRTGRRWVVVAGIRPPRRPGPSVSLASGGWELRR